jgi:hypothetical protein
MAGHTCCWYQHSCHSYRRHRHWRPSVVAPASAVKAVPPKRECGGGSEGARSPRLLPIARSAACGFPRGGAFRADSFSCGTREVGGASLACAAASMSCERQGRRRSATLSLQRVERGFRPGRRRLPVGCLGRLLFTGWGRKFHPRPARFRQPDRDRLTGRSRSMLTLANVFYFFTHVLPSFCTGGLPLGGSLASSFFGHVILRA